VPHSGVLHDQSAGKTERREEDKLCFGDGSRYGVYCLQGARRDEPMRDDV
jgi:hypothetical protein